MPVYNDIGKVASIAIERIQRALQKARCDGRPHINARIEHFRRDFWRKFRHKSKTRPVPVTRPIDCYGILAQKHAHVAGVAMAPRHLFGYPPPGWPTAVSGMIAIPSLTRDYVVDECVYIHVRSPCFDDRDIAYLVICRTGGLSPQFTYSSLLGSAEMERSRADHCMSLRTLQRRMAKLEKARKPRPSPIVVMYGSFDKFVDAGYAEIAAGKLSDEFYDIIDAMRAWEDGGVWMLAYAR